MIDKLQKQINKIRNKLKLSKIINYIGWKDQKEL